MRLFGQSHTRRSRKFASKIVHRTAPESREDGFWDPPRYASGDYVVVVHKDPGM